MRKLIALIPTGGKTKEEMNKTIQKIWPEIQNKLSASSKKRHK